MVYAGGLSGLTALGLVTRPHCSAVAVGEVERLLRLHGPEGSGCVVYRHCQCRRGTRLGRWGERERAWNTRVRAENNATSNNLNHPLKAGRKGTQHVSSLLIMPDNRHHPPLSIA